MKNLELFLLYFIFSYVKWPRQSLTLIPLRHRS